MRAVLKVKSSFTNLYTNMLSMVIYVHVFEGVKLRGVKINVFSECVTVNPTNIFPNVMLGKKQQLK